MSFRQLFERFSRVVRSEEGSSHHGDLRWADRIIDEAYERDRARFEAELAATEIAVSIGRAREILGVAEKVTEEELVVAWRREVLRWHPDRHARLDDAARRHAEERTREINLAYALLRRSLDPFHQPVRRHG